MRRNGEEYGEIKVYETWVSNSCVDSNAQDLTIFAQFVFLEEKAQAPTNPQNIIFSLAELVGNAFALERGIRKRNNSDGLDEEEESYLRRKLPKLSDGLLEILKGKVEGKRIIGLPVKYITDAGQDQVRSHEVHDLQEAVARGVKS